MTIRISIAMATYNGAKYLQEQLDSFLAQTCQPDELVVSDDGSSDSTLDLLRQFAAVAPFEVRIHENETNLGYAKNFDKAMSLCSGDIVFLSDQDDFWLPGKIEAAVTVFKDNPNVMLSMNDAEIILGHGEKTGLTKLGQTLSLGLAESSFTTGCCMGIRSSFVDFAVPSSGDHFVHDTWLNELSLVLGVKNVDAEVRQLYRRHSDNASAWIASRTTKQGKLDLIHKYRSGDSQESCRRRVRQIDALMERIFEKGALIEAELKAQGLVEAATSKLRVESIAVRHRLLLLSKSRPNRIIPATAFFFSGGYKYFSGWKSYAKDIIVR